MASTVTKEPLQQPQGSSSTTAEDESLKRNTDCVYFLASPLTCKKGSECEYRHSEYARMNPRDCYYWLNGNCLNPKCGFRHPPLDGLVAPQAGNFDGPPAPVLPVPFVTPVPQNLPKQGVPCIFFQKGYCLKGDKCPFLHGPNSSGTKIQQFPASTAAAETPFKKTFGSLEKCSQPKTNFQANKPKVEALPQANVIPKPQSARPTNGVPVGKGYQPPSGVTGETPKYEEMRPSYVGNGNSRSRSGRPHHVVSYDDQIFQNGRDTDDSLRESSPGFDVLVDDKLSEDEYYHNEDQYVRLRGHDGRNMKEFEMGRPDDYNSVADVDRDNYHNRRGYDSFDRLPPREHRRPSSERSLVEPAHFDRRGPYKSKSPDRSQNSDLRHRLSKHRRVNGLKSVVNADYSLNDPAEEGSYRNTRRASRRSPVHESSRGNRLQGRIKLPRRSSPPMGGNDIYSEKESERGRSWGRLSPSRQQVPGQQSRLRDRLSGRIQDESHDERKIKDPVMRRDTAPFNGANFAGPKSLSELRGTKPIESKQQQSKSQQSVSAGKLRDTVLGSSLGTEGDVAFEGPKPLSEILKRKRTTSSTNSYNKDEIKSNEKDVNLISMASDSASDSRKQVILSSAAEQAKASEEENKPLAAKVDEEEGEIMTKKIKMNVEDESSLPADNKEPEAVEALVVADDEEPEFDDEYDQGDGEYEYEQDEGEGYPINEGENGDHEEEFMDEDDGDDFAKKLGVSF